jgi:hypothetical protein
MNYISKTYEEVNSMNQDLVQSILVLDGITSIISNRANTTCAKQEANMLNEDFKRVNPELLNRRRNALANIWNFELIRC